MACSSKSGNGKRKSGSEHHLETAKPTPATGKGIDTPMVTREPGKQQRIAPRPSNEVGVAEWLLKEVFTFSGTMPTLAYVGGQWIQWDRTTAWKAVKEEFVEDAVFRVLKDAKYRGAAPQDSGESEDEEAQAEPVLRAWNPTSRKVGSVVRAMRALARLDIQKGEKDNPFITRQVLAGTWLNGEHDGELWVHLRDFVVNLRTRETRTLTPEFYTTTALPFEWSAIEGGCPLWLQTLEQNFNGEQDQIDLLQEWCGYLISGRTDLQKALWVYGPARSGKGLVIRVLHALLGEQNCVGLSSDRLTAGGSALALAIGKTLVSFSDARISKSQGAVETILMWTGQDALSVSIKYQDDYAGPMPGRLVFASNDAPFFKDASPAIINRFLVLKTKKSNLGKEDSTLTDRILKEELPGIFAWALEGLQRLEERKRFTDTEESQRARENARRLSNPLIAFVQECVSVSEDSETPRDDFFKTYNLWRMENELRPATKATMEREIDSAELGIKVSKTNRNGVREWKILGCDLNANAPRTASTEWCATPTPGGAPDTPAEAGEPTLTEFQETLLRVCADQSLSVGDVIFEAAIPIDQKGYTTKTLNQLARDGLLLSDTAGYRTTALGRTAIGVADQLDFEGVV